MKNKNIIILITINLILINYTIFSQNNYQAYFGNLHSHTSHSDGVSTPAEAYNYARFTAGLDFLAITDHIGSFHIIPYVPMNTLSQWSSCREAADSVTVDGSFVGLYGWEWTSEKYGHINVFDTSEMINDSINFWYNYNLQAFYSWIYARTSIIAQFNHPGDVGTLPYINWNDFSYINNTIDSIISLIEFQTIEQADYYEQALNKNWHVSPVWNQDNHDFNWGTKNDCRAGIWAISLNKINILDAIRNGRTFATMDKNAKIWIDIDGIEMGKVVPFTNNVSVHLLYEDEDNELNSSLKIISKNGVLFEKENFYGNIDTLINVNLIDEKWIYSKVIQADSNYLWSAPIYIEDVSKINIIDDKNDIHIFPNPNNDKLEISTDDKNCKLTIVDCFGKKYFEENFDYKTQIDMINFKNGIYIVEITNIDKKIVKKIVKY